MTLPLLARALSDAADHEAEVAALKQKMAAEIGQTLAAAADGLDLTVQFTLDLRGFLKLGKKAKTAIIIGANRAAKPVKEAVVGKAQSFTGRGFLGKSIGTKTKVFGTGNFTTVIGPKVSFSRGLPGKISRGPRRGEKRKAVPYRYASVLESPKAGSRYRSFLRPVWQSHRGGYLARAVDEIGKEMEKIM